MNPFRFVHTTRDGEKLPVVSMGAEHLVNTVNAYLVKGIQKYVAKARQEAYQEFAPEGMNPTQARTLGLRPLTADHRALIEIALQELEAKRFEASLEKAIPYLIVGMARNDTREGVVAVLQRATGISEMIIDVPLLEEENEEIIGELFADGDMWYPEY